MFQQPLTSSSAAAPDSKLHRELLHFPRPASITFLVVSSSGRVPQPLQP